MATAWIPLLATIVGGVVTYAAHAALTTLKEDRENRNTLLRLCAELEVLRDAATRMTAAAEGNLPESVPGWSYFMRPRWNEATAVKWALTAFTAFNDTFNHQPSWMAVVTPRTRKGLVELHLAFLDFLGQLASVEEELASTRSRAAFDTQYWLHNLSAGTQLSDKANRVLIDGAPRLVAMIDGIHAAVKNEQYEIAANMVAE